MGKVKNGKCVTCGETQDLFDDIDGAKGKIMCFSCGYELQKMKIIEEVAKVNLLIDKLNKKKQRLIKKFHNQ